MSIMNLDINYIVVAYNNTVTTNTLHSYVQHQTTNCVQQ